MKKWHSGIRACGLCALVATAALAQPWDVGGRAAQSISAASENKLKLTFEMRGRYESRTGNGFGKDADIETGLIRTRLGLGLTPVKWLKFSAMVQDSRAPWYGANAPNTVRDRADLHESYIELFPDAKKGFGLTAGRMMVNYGDGRLIGTPQWGNLSRTYDHARAYYRLAKARIELLFVSPVKVRIGEFNRPVLGDRVWGMYDVFPGIYKNSLLEVYVLRHEQNRPGGFTGGSRLLATDKLSVNTFGFRTAGGLGPSVKYNLEAAAQYGKVGPADHRAQALVAGVVRRWTIGKKPLDASTEYKFASGTKNPQDAAHSGTFDQLYAANHDKFGHEDLFGWRNLHNARLLSTFGISKPVSLNLMYDSYWLARPKDGLYNGSGKQIARSAAGTAGRHVGQEVDLFATYKYRHFALGAGYGHMFAGEFLRKTTPGIGPTYLYLFHTYAF